MEGAVEALAIEVAAGVVFFAVADDDDDEVVFGFGLLGQAVGSGGQTNEEEQWLHGMKVNG